MFAVSVFAATAVGPTLGGWITDNYSWRWIFLIKIPLCLVALLAVHRLVEDPPFLKRLKNFRFDFIGLSLLTLGVGALQVFLDKGQEDDWFGSRFITTLVIVSALCLTGLALWEWFQKEPIIDIRLFKSTNFSASCVQMFVIGVVSFCEHRAHAAVPADADGVFGGGGGAGDIHGRTGAVRYHAGGWLADVQSASAVPAGSRLGSHRWQPVFHLQQDEPGHELRHGLVGVRSAAHPGRLDLHSRHAGRVFRPAAGEGHGHCRAGQFRAPILAAA